MINIGSKRECFFDDFLIDETKNTAEKRLHKPVRREVILEFDQPWESEEDTMITVLFAEGMWKMYYICNYPDTKYVCYAESKDAVNWVRPDLGIYEFNGSKHNNIIMDTEMFKKFEFVNFDNMSVFYDENPACPEDEKYKMVCMWIGHASLVMLASSDGLHFTKHRFITNEGEFDSQNRAFWSKEYNKYFCYFRGEHKSNESTPLPDKSFEDKDANALYDPMRRLLHEPGAGTYSFLRDIRVAESDDFINWNVFGRINTTGADFQLYNNCVFPYPRAPHIFVGLPLRYAERKSWSKNYDELCGRDDRLARMENMARLGLAISDGLFMVSRDGHNFTKYDEAILPPPPENPEAFVYGDGTAVPVLVEVPSSIPGADNEYMIYVRESYRSSVGYNKLVKYTIRLDGFVSIHAGSEEVTAVTKEFVYDGGDLYANIASSARGYCYFTLKSGNEEYTSCEIFGNSVDKRIRFEDDDAVKKLSGKPVTMTMKMFDCDVYSIRFM